MYEIRLDLPEHIVEPLLDTLFHQVRIWRYTAECLEDGLARDPYEIADCADPTVATMVADDLEFLSSSIQKQIEDK